MTIFIHEMKQSYKNLLIWSGTVGLMIILCMLMYPEMKNQMTDINRMFESMGGFTAAFGMDKINFGTVMGFYGVECGSILGLGGAFFAALAGIGILSKEENGHTAEFLLTHPLSRTDIVTEKLLAVGTQVLLFNVISITCSLLSFLVIGESVLWKEFLLFHFAQLIMHMEIALICFGLSAFIKRGGLGAGIGIAILLYFLNIFGNISEKGDFVKYLTPFHFSDASNIFETGKLETGFLLLGVFYGILGIGAAFNKYVKKDITA